LDPVRAGRLARLRAVAGGLMPLCSVKLFVEPGSG
jgi:hypothetical protein